MRARYNEGCGRILLGDYAGDGAGVLRPVKLQCVGVWFIYTQDVKMSLCS
jgi:hypothetical protein